MALPTYDKTKRKKTFEQLPKGAYVVVIKDAKEEQNKNNSGTHITICFDIAEGDYKGFYQNMLDNDTREDKKWSPDARFYISVPADGCQAFVWDNWNTFFADLEDSNNGFVFGGDLKTLKGKVIGGKFHLEQSKANDGTVYNHTRLKWTCVAEDVRQGKAGKMPNDKLIASTVSNLNDFVSVPEGTDDEIPW